MCGNIKTWYRGKVADQLAQALSSYYYGLPMMGIKTLGGSKAAVAYFSLPCRPKEDFYCYDVSGRTAFGYREINGVRISDKDDTACIDDVDLSKSRLAYYGGEIYGLNLIRLIFVNWGIRRRVIQDRKEADAEYRRQENYLKSVEASRDRVELLKSIYSSFCLYGPEEFTVVDLICVIHGGEWQSSHSAYNFENKYSFLLEGFVCDQLVEQRNQKYIATPKISKAIYEHDTAISRYSEQLSIQREMHLTQKWTVRIAVCALMVSAISILFQLN